MSGWAFRWAMEQQVSDAGHKLLLATLGFRADDHDEVVVDPHEVAQMACLSSPVKFNKALFALADQGFLTRLHRGVPEGKLGVRLHVPETFASPSQDQEG